MKIAWLMQESVDNVLGLPFDTRADLKKMAACLKLRVKVHPEYMGVAGLGAWARGGHADADSDGDAGDLAGRLAGCQQEMETGKDQGVGVNNMKRLTSYYKGFMVSGGKPLAHGQIHRCTPLAEAGAGRRCYRAAGLDRPR